MFTQYFTEVTILNGKNNNIELEYEYWRIDAQNLIDMNLYSNEDILLTYKTNIVNNPLLSNNLPHFITVLAKVDGTTGATVWAKQIVNYSAAQNLEIYSTFLMNDTSWSLSVYKGADVNIPGMITKIDRDGNLVEMFYIPFSFDSNSTSNYSFYTVDFYLFSDQSFITVTSCSYNKGEFGVSEISQKDFCFFKADSNKNFKWSTSIDFLNRVEERESLFEYNDIVYVSIVTSKFYYCLLTLNKDTGVFNNWSWSYVYKEANDAKYLQLVISYASERFIYAYGNFYTNTDNNELFGLYVFDPISLKLKMAFLLQNWNRFYGFNIAELNSDAIYSINNSTIYR